VLHGAKERLHTNLEIVDRQAPVDVLDAELWRLPATMVLSQRDASEHPAGAEDHTPNRCLVDLGVVHVDDLEFYQHCRTIYRPKDAGSLLPFSLNLS
jgi:hypothetical protein